MLCGTSHGLPKHVSRAPSFDGEIGGAMGGASSPNLTSNYSARNAVLGKPP